MTVITWSVRWFAGMTLAAIAGTTLGLVWLVFGADAVLPAASIGALCLFALALPFFDGQGAIA